MQLKVWRDLSPQVGYGILKSGVTVCVPLPKIYANIIRKAQFEFNLAAQQTIKYVKYSSLRLSGVVKLL